MFEQLSGLLGLEGFTVTSVAERGDELDLEVELVTAGGCCPRCGRGSCEVKERPLVRVRDLPIAGRRTLPCLAQASLSLLRLRAHVHGVARGAAVAAAGDAAVPAAPVRAGE